MRKEIKCLCVVMIVMLFAVGIVVLGYNKGNNQDEIDRTVQKKGRK